MGLADMLKEEATLEIRVGEYRDLVEAKTMATIMKRAREKRVPESYVSMMLDESVVDVNDQRALDAYRATGITPDRLRVIDEEYRKLSKKSAGLAEEVVRLTEEKAKLFDQVKALEAKCKELEETSHGYLVSCGKKDIEIAEYVGRIHDLQNAVQSKTGELERLKERLYDDGK